MIRVVVLYLAVFVGVASAWGWGGRWGQRTECGQFKPIRSFWSFGKVHTKLNAQAMLEDISNFDSDKDGYITREEVIAGSGLSATPGIARCDYINFGRTRYGMNGQVLSAVYSTIDTNGNDLYSSDDVTVEVFMKADENGDGQVTRCELFRNYMDTIEQAERDVYERELIYDLIVYESNKPASLWGWLGW